MSVAIFAPRALAGTLLRGDPNIPIIGMARANWALDRLRERARRSLEQHSDGRACGRR